MRAPNTPPRPPVLPPGEDLVRLDYPIPAMLPHYVRLLDSQTPFAQVNYADGEWRAIKGQERGKQCDGQRYKPAIEPLRLTLREPRPYLHGITDHHHCETGMEFARRNGWPVDTLPWVNRNIIHAANIRGEAGAFFAALRRRKLLLVGPAHLGKLKLIKPVGFIEVPAREAMEAVDVLEPAVMRAVLQHDPEVICFSASFAAKVLIWRLWPRLKDLTLLDTGSIFDGYCGIRSRGSNKSPHWPERRDQNIRDALALT